MIVIIRLCVFPHGHGNKGPPRRVAVMLAAMMVLSFRGQIRLQLGWPTGGPAMLILRSSSVRSRERLLRQS